MMTLIMGASRDKAATTVSPASCFIGHLGKITCNLEQSVFKVDNKATLDLFWSPLLLLLLIIMRSSPLVSIKLI